MTEEDNHASRDYYDEFGEKEWDRLELDIAGRVSFQVHKRFLERFIKPGSQVLEIGAGPGRFTFELARIGAQITVTDYSPVQLELNRQMVSPTSAEKNVVKRSLLNVCDTSEFADRQFDAVVAYGGPLSYAFEQAPKALEGLFRITRPQGVLVASVMSILGTWRYSLPGVLDFAKKYGEELNDAVLATGDLRLSPDPEAHSCKLFRSSEILPLIENAGGHLLAASASNWASMNPSNILEDLEKDPLRWKHFLENEIAACAATGAWDGGTHILFAAR